MDMRAAALEHGVKTDEYDRLLELLGREPNLTELGLVSAMWSEHCSYKSSRVQLKKFPTTGPRVVHGPGENAGVVDIGDGQVAVFKMESHNHPSFIEPYQGAATGVGGIMRDVFTMGARPVANLNALRFGSIANAHTPRLLAGVVAGIGGYGNCVGVPTVGGETNFDPGYDGNILVNAMCVGIAERDKIFTAKAEGVGNPIVYVGSKTGRDGIHGASMSSAEFDDETEEKRPTVQVGDPFAEKLLIEACLELMGEDAVVAIQDMGAAGLTSSLVEMCAKGGLGAEVDLDRVPMREEAMTAYEIMLSESQERMLMVLKPGREALAREIFEKWDLDAAVIGALTDTKRLVLKRDGETAADIEVSPLADAAPVYRRPTAPTPPEPVIHADDVRKIPLAEALLKLMGSADLCSRRWIWEQYDSQVMADTLIASGGDAAVVRVHGANKALALTSDVTPRYCLADPREGGRQAVAEACRNLACVGAEPIGLTNCLNFGNPEKPLIMGQIAGCIEGMSEACEALGAPIVSGNVSLYNETNGVAIPPTPTVGAVGLIPDPARMARIDGAREGDRLILLGDTKGWLGRSLYLRLTREEDGLNPRDIGAPPPVPLIMERRLGDLLRELVRTDAVRCAHDLSDGGLLVAVSEIALASNLGAALNHPPHGEDPHAYWFGEDQARALVTADDAHADLVMEAARLAHVNAAVIGRMGGDAIIIGDIENAVSLDDLRAAHEGFLPTFMGED